MDEMALKLALERLLKVARIVIRAQARIEDEGITRVIDAEGDAGIGSASDFLETNMDDDSQDDPVTERVPEGALMR